MRKSEIIFLHWITGVVGVSTLGECWRLPPAGFFYLTIFHSYYGIKK